MQKADLLLRNAFVLTMDADFNLFPQGAVAITGDKILAVGPEEEITAEYSANEELDCGGKLLMPGLVNTHCHVPMTLLRGLADDLRLDVWLMGYMMPVEREFVTPEFVRLGTKIGCAEMIRSGVTTFADMYYYQDEIAEVVAEVGMRGIMGQTVLKFPSPGAASYEEALAYTERMIQKWKGHPVIVPSIAPHAIYTCTDEILKKVTEMALRYDVPVQFHVSETAGEVDAVRAEHGMPVVPYIKKLGLLDTKMIASHCVHLDEGEMRTLQHYGTGIAHNPSSNLKLASGFAQTKRMLELGCAVGIGTDGPASNNDLDMIEEIRLASLIAKASTGDPTALPARQTLLMATRLGAKALHMEDMIGSLEPGKRADLITIDLSPLHNLPQFKRDPDGIYAQVIYATKATDVRDLMVNGQWLMRERDLLTLDESQLPAQAAEMAGRIDAFLLKREGSVLSKLVAIGGAAQEESFEVQAKVQVEDVAPVLAALKSPQIQILRKRHYREYDTYYHFDDPGQGRLRYREDEFIDEAGRIENVRSRLTLIGERHEEIPGESESLLSRSRFLAPATHSLRFYAEYFKPSGLLEIQKDRLRYLVRFEDEEFFINLDTLIKPALGKFVEVKSRTWSRQDAVNKTELLHRLLEALGLGHLPIISDDYIHLVEESIQGV